MDVDNLDVQKVYVVEKIDFEDPKVKDVAAVICILIKETLVYEKS